MKKTIIAIVIILAVTAGVYFGLDHFRPGVPTLEQGFGIWESEQAITANPGGSNIATLTIINGQDKDRTFWVSLEQASPDKLLDGYECLPTKYFSWFTPSGWDGSRVTVEPKVIVKAGQYRQVSILVAIPTSTNYLDQPAELRVRVTEIDSGNFQITALESRWYIVVVETPD